MPLRAIACRSSRYQPFCRITHAPAGHIRGWKWYGLPTVTPAKAGVQGWGCGGLPRNAEVQDLRFLDSLRSLGMTMTALVAGYFQGNYPSHCGPHTRMKIVRFPHRHSRESGSPPPHHRLNRYPALGADLQVNPLLPDAGELVAECGQEKLIETRLEVGCYIASQFYHQLVARRRLSFP